MFRIICLVSVCAFALVGGCPMNQNQHSYVPPERVVPNQSTAEAIAEAVLIPIYGKENIDSQKPFHTTLESGVWRVSGTLPKRSDGMEWVGGVAEIEIARSDGRIVRITHGE